MCEDPDCEHRAERRRAYDDDSDNYSYVDSADVPPFVSQHPYAKLRRIHQAWVAHERYESSTDDLFEALAAEFPVAPRPPRR